MNGLRKREKLKVRVLEPFTKTHSHVRLNKCKIWKAPKEYERL